MECGFLVFPLDGALDDFLFAGDEDAEVALAAAWVAGGHDPFDVFIADMEMLCGEDSLYCLDVVWVEVEFLEAVVEPRVKRLAGDD